MEDISASNVILITFLDKQEKYIKYRFYSIFFLSSCELQGHTTS